MQTGMGEANNSLFPTFLGLIVIKQKQKTINPVVSEGMHEDPVMYFFHMLFNAHLFVIKAFLHIEFSY